MNFLKSIVLGASLICPTFASAVTVSAEISADIVSTSWDLSNPVISAGTGGPAFGVGDKITYSFDFDTTAAPIEQGLYHTGQVRRIWAGSNGTITIGSVTTTVDTSFVTNFFPVAGSPNTFRLEQHLLVGKPAASGSAAQVPDLAVPFFLENQQFKGTPFAFHPSSSFTDPVLSAPLFPLEVSEQFANVFCIVCTPSDQVTFDLGLSNLSYTETGRTTPPVLPPLPTPVPVPAPLLLLLASLFGLSAMARRSKTV